MGSLGTFLYYPVAIIIMYYYMCHGNNINVKWNNVDYFLLHIGLLQTQFCCTLHNAVECNYSSYAQIQLEFII